MASTYSSNLKIELIGTGEQAGIWGTTTNNNFTNVFEQAIVGRGNANFSTDADLTLTFTDSVSSQTARNVYLNATSSVSLTTTRNLIVPTINKNYVVQNNTTGSQSIVVKTAAGTGITIPNGFSCAVYVDGTDVIQASTFYPSVRATSITNTSLTSGRITYAGASGLLQDSAGLTFDGTNFTTTGTASATKFIPTGGTATGNGMYLPVANTLAFSTNGSEQVRIDSTGNVGIGNNSPTTKLDVTGSIKSSALTSGRVTFSTTAGQLTDSANLTWNGSTLGITGALTASSDSSFTSTGALSISKGTTGQRPGTPASGMLRFNTTSSEFEGYNGTAWASVGGAGISNDTTTSSSLYPLFANATTGTASTLFTSNAKLLYRPSDGQLSASEMYASNGVLTHANQVTSNYTVPTNANVITVGPWTVASGASFTLPSGSRQVLL